MDIKYNLNEEMIKVDTILRWVDSTIKRNNHTLDKELENLKKHSDVIQDPILKQYVHHVINKKLNEYS